MNRTEQQPSLRSLVGYGPSSKQMDPPPHANFGIILQNSLKKPLMFVLVDVDGTLALRGDREPFDWSKASLDSPNIPVIEVVRALAGAGFKIAYLSGRDERIRQLTQDWLDIHVQVTGTLLMRQEGDGRPDDLVKEEIVRSHFSDLSKILLVLDDRNRVVNMWRDRIGLVCFQVADGDF